MEESHNNTLFTFTCFMLLISTLHHSYWITNKTEISSFFYPSYFYRIILSSLFVNFGLVVFSFFIIMNLNDFFLKRCLNRVGVTQKLKIVGVPLVLI